ncbi:nucleotidyltransferase [Pontibacter vulgaris]|uniref:nucleotidyltransferase n=1 Tax=Pontibacter vulgaris TaxID=2905679 RepID=UPI001FA8182E|nr:nucleotidyltransferase [Pontibacter vulgaris]
MAKETKSKEDNKKLEAQGFYREALELLNKSGCPYLVGGGFALREYTGIIRETKDLDVFCKAGEYPRILKVFAEAGYETENSDARWLAKAIKGEHFVDLIFNNPGNFCPVDDTWFDHAVKGELWGVQVQYIPAEELIWCKTYVQNRERFDGADINHIILRYGDKLNWKRVMVRMEQHWHLLLAQLLTFQFVYPSERDIIPRWLFDELLSRAKEQFDVPAQVDKICRGPFFDQTQYGVDITEWDYKVMTIRTI